jgi:hypothetical protein
MTTRIQRQVEDARFPLYRDQHLSLPRQAGHEGGAAVHGLSWPTRLAGVVCEPEKELKS